ncbi:hypothetical protein Cabys_1717 [Caldithrix abyssi DSM 13497]|uniref:Uncharacterized protein n=1 Tax=Caldithrix abyssi DSM 13497 TaxID=880073 RepID=A0A1J1C8Z1_CALAY|nr:hypothetical protein Cabys_1717 [Caldithrix abyssi DSM 13497]
MVISKDGIKNNNARNSSNLKLKILFISTLFFKLFKEY